MVKVSLHCQGCVNQESNYFNDIGDLTTLIKRIPEERSIRFAYKNMEKLKGPKYQIRNPV